MGRSFGLTILVGVLFFAVCALVFLRGPDLSAYDRLKTPSLRSMPAEKMLVVETSGNSDTAARQGIGLLFKTWYQLHREYNGFRKAAPRGRRPTARSAPPSQWYGWFGLPVPESVDHVPPGIRKSGAVTSVRIETWQYGEVAEILHVGPYAAEQASIEKLKGFIADRGYRIVGEHEEEYLRGPGMFEPGNPQKYYTIIRYRVERPSPVILADSTSSNRVRDE